MSMNVALTLIGFLFWKIMWPTVLICVLLYSRHNNIDFTFFRQLSAPRIEGQTEVVFVDGIAVFTRLRVNKPSSNLRLSFITNPGSFEATTFMSFSVVEPSDDVVRKEIILKFIGNTATLSTLKYSDVIDDLKLSLSKILDVDLSRIQNVEFVVEVTK